MATASVSASRAPRPRRQPAASVPRIRWDRLGRIAILFVMVAIAYLYLSAGARLLSTWHEAKRDSAQVRSLEHQNRALRAQRATLTSRGTVQTEARRLGMIRKDEQAYVVSGLPAN